jgi:hypothetical protein
VVIIVVFVISAAIMQAKVNQAQMDAVLHEARSLSAASQSFIETQPTLSLLLSGH